MLNIECRKNILMENINIVSKAVAVRSTMPITSCILLISDRKGFRLLANDMEISIESDNMQAEVYELGTVAIDAKIFADTVRSFADDIIKIKADDKNNVDISSGKAFFRLKGQPGDDFPMPSQLDKTDKPLKIQADAMKNMIKKTIFAVASEDSRPILTGELIKVENSVLNIVAIDGFRVSWRSISTDFDENISIVVPAKALNEVARLLPESNEEFVNIYFTQRHALFEFKGCCIVSRLLEGEFLNYENLFSCDSTTEVIVERDLFLKCLERTTVVSNDSKKTKVDLKLKDNVIIVDANEAFGNVHEEISAEISGNDLDISFNSRYILDILKSVEDEKISFNFMTAKSPCIIKSTTGVEYKYLVLPLINF